MTKPTKWDVRLCAQQRLRSAWVSAQSDQSPVSQLPTGRTCHFVDFVMRRLNFFFHVSSEIRHKSNGETRLLSYVIVHCVKGSRYKEEISSCLSYAGFKAWWESNTPFHLWPLSQGNFYLYTRFSVLTINDCHSRILSWNHMQKVFNSFWL